MKTSSILILLVTLSAGTRVILVLYNKTCLWRRIAVSAENFGLLRENRLIQLNSDERKDAYTAIIHILNVSMH